MRIGIDIDGVLTNDDDYILDYTSKYCYENNLNSFTKPYEYEYNKLNWNKETRDDYRAKYFWNYIDNEPARRFASEVIKKLKEDGHKIYIITGRHKSYEQSEVGENMRNKIKVWLNKNDIIYDELICTQTPKLKEIQSNKIDLMIEDSSETILVLSKFIHVFCFDTRYNRNLECDNMTRVFSWYDIYMKLLKLTKQLITLQTINL